MKIKVSGVPYEVEMPDLRKAAEMALNYFESAYELDSHEIEIRAELRQALAQPEQKPFIVDRGCWERGCACYDDRVDKGGIEVVKKEWVGLTDEEIDGIYKTHHDQYGKCQTGGFEYERTIEAKLKEKNT